MRLIIVVFQDVSWNSGDGMKLFWWWYRYRKSVLINCSEIPTVFEKMKTTEFLINYSTFSTVFLERNRTVCHRSGIIRYRENCVDSMCITE